MCISRRTLPTIPRTCEGRGRPPSPLAGVALSCTSTAGSRNRRGWRDIPALVRRALHAPPTARSCQEGTAAACRTEERAGMMVVVTVVFLTVVAKTSAVGGGARVAVER